MHRQFVVQLDNRPGELAHLARALGERGVDITEIACAGTGTIACAFMTTSNIEDARQVLKGLGHEFIEGQTIVVDKGERRLVGAFIAGPGASEAIHEAVLAIKTKTPIDVLADTIHAFPTTARVLGTVFVKAARAGATDRAIQ